MSIVRPPLIREEFRSESEIIARVTDRLEAHGFAPAGVDPLKDALVNVFGRYCEILIERLNQVPESHHQAFLSMLGATPAPAVPARVPLSFKAVESTQDFAAIVPKSTQVSAPAENGSDPAVFETSKDLPLVRAELARAVAVDTRRLIHADVSSVVSTASAAGFNPPLLLSEAVPLERALHIGQRVIIGLPGLTRLRLKIDLEPAGQLPAGAGIEWGLQSEAGFTLLQPELDTTDGLTHSGELAFIPPEKWPSGMIFSTTLPWLTCRLRPGSTSQFASSPAPSVRRHSVSITRIELSAHASAAAIPVEGAYHGNIPLDVSRDFFPLGERPRFGEVFYVRSESFAVAGARVAIDIKLTNPAGAKNSPIPVVSSRGNPQLRWEGHTARGWIDLDCADGTLSLTQDGKLDFLAPGDAVPATINGVKSGWVRARLVGGHYAADPPGGNDVFPPMNPPSIAAMLLTSFSEFGPVAPEYLIVESNLEYRKIDPLLAQPFDPFPCPVEQGVMLYLGLTARSAVELAGHTVSLYALPSEGNRRVFCRDSIVDAVVAPRWQARGATGWHDCAVNDLTQGLSGPGIIEVRVPEELSKWHESVLDPQQQFLWLRLVWDNREADRLPCPRRLLLNTVLASQTMRLQNELLGSSNGRPGQIFHTLHLPVIGELALEVRESGGKAGTQPGTRSNETSRYRFGSMKIPTLPVNEVWVHWSGVEDFSASGSHSRHYIVDRLTGSIRFGDGRNGRIPPSGANNVRLREYRAGGGRRGNRPAGTINRLHTTIPYVESVTNHEPAGGGQDREDLSSLSQGAAAQLRHRDRAVCSDDYADLARKASPEVAYAKCITARDLLRDPMRRETETGTVSLIVVPHCDSNEPRPQPSFELVKNVKAFLDARRPIGVDLIVLGPEYVSIDVRAEIAWTAGHSVADAAAECQNRLSRFLHPLTGGLDGHGWPLGQQPQASDIYPLLGAIEGLDHIRALELRSREERPGLLSAGTFLICSGKHEIQLC